MTDAITMTPADVLKLIKRARAKGPVNIGMHVGVDMPSTDNKFYPMRVMVNDMSMRQAMKILFDLQIFHNRKVEMGQAAPMLEVSDTVSEFDKRTRFISFG